MKYLCKTFLFHQHKPLLYLWLCFVISFFGIFLSGVYREVIPNTDVNPKGKIYFLSNVLKCQEIIDRASVFGG